MPKTPKGSHRFGSGAEVYFVDLKDGATVPAKLTIHFGLRNMGVGPPAWIASIPVTTIC
jgi:hypothetical protein